MVAVKNRATTGKRGYHWKRKLTLQKEATTAKPTAPTEKGREGYKVEYITIVMKKPGLNIILVNLLLCLITKY